MKQGEVWMTDFGEPSGPEQAGLRPAIVMQDDLLTPVLTTVIVVPLTTNLKRLTLPPTLLFHAGEGGLPQDSVALYYQIQVRGKVRLLSRLGA
ncbi:MAG: type II toxin-antitoxin system PemK/MazF family toxin, partial [Armatimonadota bacterium]|nr:type II toxin-antitoxin system PemK/MazF family toxin [Armatimonadota bacterium]